MQPSSSPTGAPNAADTPAAAPAETKSRFSVSLRKYSKICNGDTWEDASASFPKGAPFRGWQGW